MSRSFRKRRTQVLVAGIACLLPWASSALAQRAVSKPVRVASTPEERLQLALERTEELEQECLKLAREAADRREKAGKLEAERVALREHMEALQKRLAELTQSEKDAHALAKAAQQTAKALLAERSAPSSTGPRAVSPSAKTLEGEVLAVQLYGLVSLSLGSKDGLAAGVHLDVFRSSGGQRHWRGRVLVVGVEADRAIARALPEFEQAAIEKGDRVTSRLGMIGVPPIEGAVGAVADCGLVRITADGDHRLLLGHRLDVLHADGQRQIRTARIEVIAPTSDGAVCRTVHAATPDGVGKGDRVLPANDDPFAKRPIEKKNDDPLVIPPSEKQ